MLDTLVSRGQEDNSLAEAPNSESETSSDYSHATSKIADLEAKDMALDVTMAPRISEPGQNKPFRNNNRAVIKKSSASLLDGIVNALSGLGSSSSSPDSESKPNSTNPSKQHWNATGTASSTAASNPLSSTYSSAKGGSSASPMGVSTSSMPGNESMGAISESNPAKKTCPCSCLCGAGSIPRSDNTTNSLVSTSNTAGSNSRMVEGTGVILSDGSCACSCSCPSGSFSEVSGIASSHKDPSLNSSSQNDPKDPQHPALSEPAIISQTTPVKNPPGQAPAGQALAGQASVTELSEPPIISQPTPTFNTSSPVPADQVQPAILSPLISAAPQMISSPAQANNPGSGTGPIDIPSYSLSSSLNLGPLSLPSPPP